MPFIYSTDASFKEPGQQLGQEATQVPMIPRTTVLAQHLLQPTHEG